MEASRLSALGRHAEIMRKVYARINEVHKRPLHPAQVKVAKDYFTKGIRVCMSQWARNCGKTECALFLATVACLLNDNFQVMIVCPELKQGKKIYWHKKRLQNYPPPEYIKDINSTEMKVEFNNGSFITVDGCENYESLRGVKPDLVIYDEFQHHSKEFHLEVMEPNLLSVDKCLYIFGTPPKRRSAYYVEYREQLLKLIKNDDVTTAYYEFDASVNPVNDPALLAARRKQLIESDNEVIWYREYEGKLAFGGEDVVFPKWNPEPSGVVGHWRRHKVLMSYLENDKSKLKWYTIFDPGTSTCFAVLFIAYNPYTQQIYVLDEIYEKDRKRTTAKQIWERARKKEQELYFEGTQVTWRRIYDEAAAWFHNEVSALYKGQRLNLSPSQKQSSNEETDISRIKMAMAEPQCFHVSDRCYWLRWEIESFVTDEKGEYPDKNNHLIDDLKYFMQTSSWTLLERAEEFLHNEYSAVKAVEKINPSEWADAAVENSLDVNPHDFYSEYYN